MTTRCRITCGMGEFLVWVAVDVMPALRPESESRDEKLMEIVVCALHRFASLCIALLLFLIFFPLFLHSLQRFVPSLTNAAAVSSEKRWFADMKQFGASSDF